jgi:hypothetical protein
LTFHHAIKLASMKSLVFSKRLQFSHFLQRQTGIELGRTRAHNRRIPLGIGDRSAASSSQ